jgi:uncharacterized membrane protein
MASTHDAIEWIYGTAASVAIRDASWIVPTVQALHICAITVVVGSALVTELRIAGVIAADESLNVVARRYLPWMWSAVAVLLATGLVMVVGEPERVLANYVFWLKMGLVLAGVLLSVYLRRPLLRSTGEAQGEPTKALAWLLLILWIAVIFSGRWIAYIN